MIKVKTFTESIEVFKTARELNVLDDMVNEFITKEDIKRVVSVSDSITTDNTGATIGIIRVLAYEV